VLAVAALGAFATAAPAAGRPRSGSRLDRDHPGLGRLTVGYAVVRHADRSQPPLEPIVAFEGGPGFEGTRLVSDVGVSAGPCGTAAPGSDARLRLSGAATGVLGVSFRTDAAGAIATISGRIGARTVHLQTPARWAPQG
jgi:hypothetical protein